MPVASQRQIFTGLFMPTVSQKHFYRNVCDRRAPKTHLKECLWPLPPKYTFTGMVMPTIRPKSTFTGMVMPAIRPKNTFTGMGYPRRVPCISAKDGDVLFVGLDTAPQLSQLLTHLPITDYSFVLFWQNISEKVLENTSKQENNYN